MHDETLRAALERRLIRRLLLATAQADSDEQRNTCLEALADLVHHADITLDPAKFEPWVGASLMRLNLWIWPRERTLHDRSWTTRASPA